MIEHIKLEGVPFWITERTVYLGWDGREYETENEALRTWGFSTENGNAEWIDASTLGDESRRLVLGRFVYER